MKHQTQVLWRKTTPNTFNRSWKLCMLETVRRPYHRNHSKRQDVFVRLTGESCPAAVDLSSLDLKHMVIKNVVLAVQSSKRQVILKTCSRKALISGLSINQIVTLKKNVCIGGEIGLGVRD